MGYQRDREDFMVQAARHGVGDFDRRALLRASSTLQRLNEIQSSIEQTEYQEKRTDRAMERAEARANAVVKRLGAGWGIEHQGDPRGYAFSIITPTGDKLGVPGRGLPARCFT